MDLMLVLFGAVLTGFLIGYRTRRLDLEHAHRELTRLQAELGDLRTFLAEQEVQERGELQRRLDVAIAAALHGPDAARIREAINEQLYGHAGPLPDEASYVKPGPSAWQSILAALPELKNEKTPKWDRQKALAEAGLQDDGEQISARP